MFLAAYLYIRETNFTIFISLKKVPASVQQFVPFRQVQFIQRHRSNSSSSSSSSSSSVELAAIVVAAAAAVVLD